MEKCISLKMLYDKFNIDGFCELNCGYEIEHSSEEETNTDYYDLIDNYGHIVCMDGENCQVIYEEDKDRYKLINRDGEVDTEFYMTKEELLIATVG